MSIAARIAATRVFDPSRFVPFDIDGRIAGQVRRDFVARLADFPDVFLVGDRIRFQPRIAAAQARTRIMQEVARELARCGLLSPWRDETYPVIADDGGEPQFHLERCAMRFFGFTARAVHVNGVTDGGRSMWIAQRSPSKAIDPGRYDNIIGGGMASGLSAIDTLRKEAWEEAGIGPELAATAVRAGRFFVQREADDGLHAEWIEAFDLALPADLVPVNQDGEVAGFRKLSLQALIAELEADAPYTVDAAAVAIDWLARMRAIDAPALSSPD